MRIHKPHYALSCAVSCMLLSGPLAQAQARISDQQHSVVTATGLETKVAELHQDLLTTREELAQSREEIRQLRIMLQRIEQHLATSNQSEATTDAQQSNDNAAHIRDLEEKQEILQSQMEQHEQLKVASMSKYPVKITGLLLVNTAFNSGRVDNADVPELALPRLPNQGSGAFTATLRQSILGLEATGPSVWGAKSSANIYADFFGGFPDADFGVAAGLVRLRTGRIRLDWPHTSLVFGQESPFFSPLSPTSLATLGQPALAWAGNLWSWTPQIRAEHEFRVSGTSSLQVQAGILDPIDSSRPAAQSFREPSPGEQSRQPGYASRVAWTRQTREDRPLTLGLGGFLSPHRYSFNRRINAWTGTADFRIPFAHSFELSGEAYRGNAVGGLGGGQFASFVASGDLAQPSTTIVGLNSVGVWGQLKYRASSRLEFNGAVGHDNPFASDLERFPTNVVNNPVFARNQTSFMNFIFTPESSLLFSVEFRHIQSYLISGRRSSAEQINLAAGYSF